MKYRFVTCSDLVSKLIRGREGAIQPFTPSHVEIVVTEGYLGAHYDGGVQIRPVGYDKAQLLDELFVDVPLPDEAAAEAWARSKIGEPYDWGAILDFELPLNAHQPEHVICSAFSCLAARKGGYFTTPLAATADAVSPRDYLLILSTRIAIPRIIANVAELAAVVQASKELA